jgi:hypothetical protein
MKKFLRRNSSTILTCAGAVGVVATSVMAVKATPKVLTLIEKAEKEKGDKLTKWETVKVAGPTYIPAVITGAATIACIFGSNVISKHQQAALMSAYALLDSSYKEYQKKVDEVYGEDAGKQVRAEIAKDKYTGDNVLSDDNSKLFYDFFSGRYFESTMERVLKAEYEINRALYVNYSVSVNEFYEALGIMPMPEFEDMGWSCGQIEEMYWHNWIEFDHEETILDDDADGNEGLECTIIYMPLPPYIDYDYY